MPIADAVDGERARQRVPVELWRRSGARDRAHVYEQRDVDRAEELDEFGESPRGVADRENGIARLVIHFRRFVSTDPLYISMWPPRADEILDNSRRDRCALRWLALVLPFWILTAGELTSPVRGSRVMSSSIA
jgi:hypothetical protein